MSHRMYLLCFVALFMLPVVINPAYAELPADVNSAVLDGAYETGPIDAQTIFSEAAALDVFNIVEEPNTPYRCSGCIVPDTVANIPGNDDSATLYGASSITTVQIGGNHYALVAFYYDEDIQIIDITDPANPTTTAYVTDSDDGFTDLGRASSITTVQIGGNHYALVASYSGGGIRIIDITDPANPTPTASVTDVVVVVKHAVSQPANPAPTAGRSSVNSLGEAASSVTTVQIGQNHYALVASNHNGNNIYVNDGGILIIDITDPANPTPTAGVIDGKGGFDELGGASSVTTVQIGQNYYALVASSRDDGVQIIDITDPANPQATASMTDGRERF